MQFRLLISCAATSPPLIQTTRLSSTDLDRLTSQMAASILAVSNSNNLDLAHMVIVTDRVVNRTNHLMDPGEKKLFLAALRSRLSASESLRATGLIFVASPDELSDFSPPMSLNRNAHDEEASSPTIRGVPSSPLPPREGVGGGLDFQPATLPGPGPTHALTATFTTLTRVDRAHREDTYHCAFQLLDLRTRAIVWEDGADIRSSIPRGKSQ